LDHPQAVGPTLAACPRTAVAMSIDPQLNVRAAHAAHAARDVLFPHHDNHNSTNEAEGEEER